MENKEIVKLMYLGMIDKLASQSPEHKDLIEGIKNFDFSKPEGLKDFLINKFPDKAEELKEIFETKEFQKNIDTIMGASSTILNVFKNAGNDSK